MHHGTCVAHVPWCMSRSLRWRGKRSRHPRRIRNPKFCVSGKRPIGNEPLPESMMTQFTYAYMCDPAPMQNFLNIRQVKHPKLYTPSYVLESRQHYKKIFMAHNMTCLVWVKVSTFVHLPMMFLSTDFLPEKRIVLVTMNILYIIFTYWAQDNQQGYFKVSNWFSLRFLGPWMNHLPSVWWYNFKFMFLNDSWCLTFT